MIVTEYNLNFNSDLLLCTQWVCSFAYVLCHMTIMSIITMFNCRSNIIITKMVTYSVKIICNDLVVVHLCES